MNAANQLLASLAQKGIQVVADSDHLLVTPSLKVTERMAEQLRTHKEELLGIVTTIDELRLWLGILRGRGAEFGLKNGKPWIKLPRNIDTPGRRRDWHDHQEAIARILAEGSPKPIITPHFAPSAVVDSAAAERTWDDDGWPTDSVVQPPPCPKCGSLDLWETMSKRWRCLKCDPPRTAMRLLALAERLRKAPRIVACQRPRHGVVHPRNN